LGENDGASITVEFCIRS